MHALRLFDNATLGDLHGNLIGIEATSRNVSKYLAELVRDGHVERTGSRGHYLYNRVRVRK